MELFVDGTPYKLTSEKLRDPLLKVRGNGEEYAFFSVSAPRTPTILFDEKYLNQPTESYTKTFTISIKSSGGRVDKNYQVRDVLSADFKLTGTVIMDERNWIEHSGNHGDLFLNGASILNIGHHFEGGGRETINRSGTSKGNSNIVGDINIRIGLDGVGSYSWEEIIHHGHGDTDHIRHHADATTYFQGTLIITGIREVS